MSLSQFRISRRRFWEAAIGAGAAASRLWGAASRTADVLRNGLAKYRIPCTAAMVGTRDKTLYAGAFGNRDAASGVALGTDAVFRIASMTKPVTTAAALQLVEQGKVTLHDPVSRYLPEFESAQVLDSFDGTTPKFRDASRPVTLHHLLTHTSGLTYPYWDPTLAAFTKARLKTPAILLRFDPGARWQYGPGVDWAGRLVERVSGTTLEGYLRQHILEPLEMTDTTFIPDATKFDRMPALGQRQPDGAIQEGPRTLPAAPTTFNGGSGLYSSAPDFLRFMQMILRGGRGPTGERILKGETVAFMTTNQIGRLTVTPLKSCEPQVTHDLDLHPGAEDQYTFGFLRNPAAYAGGRSAGSLAWAGMSNCYFWIDPRRQLCAVILMQFVPFLDPGAVALLRDFEHSVYATL